MRAVRRIAIPIVLALLGCGDAERPRLKVNLDATACKPSCSAPQYEFLVIRNADGGNSCALAARTANPGGGSLLFEGVAVGPAEQVTVAVRVICPALPGGCPHDCFVAQAVTAVEGAVTLKLAPSMLPLCFTDSITETPTSCAK